MLCRTPFTSFNRVMSSHLVDFSLLSDYLQVTRFTCYYWNDQASKREKIARVSDFFYYHILPRCFRTECSQVRLAMFVAHFLVYRRQGAGTSVLVSIYFRFSWQNFLLNRFRPLHLRFNLFGYVCPAHLERISITDFNLASRNQKSFHNFLM